MLSFFPRGVLDEILNLIESVFEDFPSYSSIVPLNNMPKKLHYQVKLLTKTSFYKKICEESMGPGRRQTLLRVETCAHHVLTGTYDKRLITGLNCSY